MEVVPGADDYRERLRADFAAGSAADVMVISYLDFAGLMARGLFTPVAPLLEASTVLTETDFYPQVVSPFRWKRRLACLPQAASGLVVYYNRDLFAQAGVAEPPPDWDWERFTATAQALTRDLDGDGRTDQFGLGLEPGLVSLAPFVWQNQGDLVESPGWPTRFVLNRLPGLKAVEWYADLQVKIHAVPDAEAEAAEPSLDRFTAGSMGMYLGSRAAVAGLRQAAGFDWDVAPLPRQPRPALQRATGRRLLPLQRLEQSADRLALRGVRRLGPRSGRAGGLRPGRARAALGGRVGRLPGPVGAAGPQSDIRRHSARCQPAAHRGELARYPTDRGR